MITDQGDHTDDHDEARGGTMTDEVPPGLDLLGARLRDALRAARLAQRGVPAELEPIVRAWARAQREAGVEVARVVIDVKALVRHAAGGDEPVFRPRVVGWAIAGYYAGTGRRG